MSDTVVGIDLGTTNSLIGAVVGGKVVLFEDTHQSALLPSVVGTGDAGEVLVGRAARNRRLVAPEGTVVQVKRLMGREHELSVGERRLSPEQVSALILGALLDRAEAALGFRPARSVITVPAFFNDAQRQATKNAGELAGLTVERLVNEPTAAAMHHQTGAEQLVLVYDFGGGTFDTSILERDAGLLEVKTSRGDTALGGSDVDRALLRHVLARLGPDGARVESDTRAMTRLEESVERAKIALSERERVRVLEPFLTGQAAGAVHLDITLERSELERIAEPFIERTLSCIDRALADAKLTAARLDRVVLVGGMSRMPCVNRRVSEHLKRPVLVDPDADLVVARGAALLAGRIAGLDIDDVLIDITPHTLAAGVADSDSPFNTEDDIIASSVIPRDTIVPVERTRTYYTLHDDQSTIELPIVQGEAVLAKDNTRLGTVTVDDLPAGPRHAPVEVTFRLDLSGVLDVSALHVPSGKSTRVTFSDSPYRLSGQRLQSARKELESLRAIEPPVGSAHDAPSEAELSLAKAMVKRADSALASSLPTTEDPRPRERVEAARAHLVQTIEARAPDLIEATDELSDALLDLV